MYEAILNFDSTQTEQEENETTNSTGKDKADGDKSKPAKNNDHVEVLLKVRHQLGVKYIDLGFY